MSEVRRKVTTGAVVIAASSLMVMFGAAIDTVGARDGKPGAFASGGSIPAMLSGTWGFAVATGNYCDSLKHCAPGSGGSISFTLRPDGRAESVLFESVLLNGCGEIQTLTRKTGTATVRGSNILFSPVVGTYESVNGCRPDLTGTWNFEPKDLKPVSLNWQVVQDERDPSRNVLKLVDPDNELSGTYRRR